MQTDKELYHIFRICPEMMFFLAHLPTPRGCKFDSITIKALERRLDGLITPEDPSEPLTVLEIQFKRCLDIYQRIIVEMALVQPQHTARLVQGIIFFAEASMDPGTEPWKSSGLVRCVYLKEELQNLELQTPDHPLVAVLKPIFEPSNDILEKEASIHYRRLEHSSLSPEQRETLCAVFVSLLTQRLSLQNSKQIAMILDLPDIRDTVCGQELIAEGKAEGWVKGKAEGRVEGKAEGKAEGAIDQLRVNLRAFAIKKFGPLPTAIETGIHKLDQSKGNELFDHLLEITEFSALERWLHEHSAL